MRNLYRVITSIGFVVACVVATTASPQELVDGPGKDIFVKTCSACHEVTTATQRRMSETDWQAMVNRMVDMGAQATPAEIDKISAYLATNYNLAPTKPK